jgi:glucan phosphorylase
MSANMNGAIHISTPDGWACEANPDNCYIFGSTIPMIDHEQDRYDADCLMEALEEAKSAYYDNKPGLYEKALAAKLEAETQWDSGRMMREYAALYGIEV